MSASATRPSRLTRPRVPVDCLKVVNATDAVALPTRCLAPDMSPRRKGLTRQVWMKWRSCVTVPGTSRVQTRHALERRQGTQQSVHLVRRVVVRDPGAQRLLRQAWTEGD